MRGDDKNNAAEACKSKVDEASTENSTPSDLRHLENRSDNNSDNNSDYSSENDRPIEVGGRGGLDPTRYGDWEKAGRCIDF